MKSTFFRIQIQKENKIVADLKFPIFTLELIDTLIPEKAQEYLKTSSIDTKEILKRIKDTNYIPQTVLEFENEGRQFKLWIE